MKYPCQLGGPEAWGNLLAFKDEPSEERLAKILSAALAKTAAGIEKTKSPSIINALVPNRVIDAFRRYTAFYRTKRGMSVISSVLMVALLQLDSLKVFFSEIFPFIAPDIAEFILTFGSAVIVLILIPLLYGRIQYEVISANEEQERRMELLRRKTLAKVDKSIERIAALERSNK